MRAPTAILVGLLGVLWGVPAAAAQDCTLGSPDLCDAAKSANLDAMFGDFADLALILLGLLLVAAILVLLVALLRRLRPRRLLKLRTEDRSAEIEPSGSVRFRAEVENLQAQQPVDVFVQRAELPVGWDSRVTAMVELPSGFLLPTEMGDATNLELTAASRGAHRARLDVELTAPSDASDGDVLEYQLSAVPVVGGEVRESKGKRASFSATVTAKEASVKIVQVVHEPPELHAGVPVLTRASLVNRGEKDAVDVPVVLSVNGAELDRKIVPEVPVSGRAEVEFEWTPAPGENTIKLSLRG